MKIKKITTVLLAGIMAVSVLAGCGINKEATVATFKDGTKVSLGLVNFMCRYQQAYSEDMYTSYLELMYGIRIYQEMELLCRSRLRALC